MKHAVIVGHPDPNSFTLAVAKTYCEALRDRGHEPVLRDLYRSGFDPCLKAGEIPRPGGFAPADDVKAERALVRDADVFAFIYPLWFYAPPAIVKGYLDRVFGMGFGYGPILSGGNQPLLVDRKMITFSASGAPSEWLEEEGSWNAIRTLFDSHLSRVCGLKMLDHVHFGAVTPGLPEHVVDGYLQTVRDKVAAFF
jgi:NAD(P)H dehydrogenase (quinone)